MSENPATTDGSSRLLTRRDLETMIARKSVIDPAFRDEFLADPAGCFTKYLNVPAANLPKFVVHEETPGSWHIVLPPKPDPMRELTDEELEQVSGGLIVEAVVITAVLSLGIAANTLASVAVAGGAVGTAAIGTTLNHKW